ATRPYPLDGTNDTNLRRPTIRTGHVIEKRDGLKEIWPRGATHALRQIFGNAGFDPIDPAHKLDFLGVEPSRQLSARMAIDSPHVSDSTIDRLVRQTFEVFLLKGQVVTPRRAHHAKSAAREIRKNLSRHSASKMPAAQHVADERFQQIALDHGALTTIERRV